MSLPSEWFCALLDSATDVYFRYALEPKRRFAYISPSVEALTGRTAAEFYADPAVCLSTVASADRPLLRRILRARGQHVLVLRLQRDGVALPVELRTIALIRKRRLIAIEGVVRLAISAQTHRTIPTGFEKDGPEPVQQRLAALMFQVHDLLHRVLPTATTHQAAPGARILRLGNLALDCDRLSVTDSGEAVALTAREVMLLRYLLERPGRIVTRSHVLEEVWGYSYTGDDRTVDVHVSRLRRKLPSLRRQLIAIRNIGYRLDDDEARQIANC